MSESTFSNDDLHIAADHEDGWQDIEPDEGEQGQIFKSLFEDRWFSNITEMMRYDEEKHGFNYVDIKRRFSWYLPSLTIGSEPGGRFLSEFDDGIF